MDLKILYHMMNEELQFVMEVRWQQLRVMAGLGCCYYVGCRCSLLQVTNRTRADIKGGILVEYDGRARLLEAAEVRCCPLSTAAAAAAAASGVAGPRARMSALCVRAQVPHAQHEEFSSIKKFGVFNTNNLWVDIKAMTVRARYRAAHSRCCCCCCLRRRHHCAV